MHRETKQAFEGISFMHFRLSVPDRASIPLATVLWLSLTISGCAIAPAPDKTANWSPNRIYSEAKEEANSGGYEKAIPLFEKLEGRAAGTPLAQQAQLEKAYAQYKAGEQAQAIATLDRFIKLHPSSPALDYALYLKGLVNFNDNLGLFGFISQQDLSERDQKSAKESFESFRELATRFPGSRYTPDANLRMGYIVNSLAQSEVHVARYYYSRGAYVAAINRAQTAISEYRDVPALEEATFILFKSYDALGMNDLRDDARRILEKTYPQSTYLSRGFKPKENPWYKFW
jgi:outer membrane protein assembly factor BamD